MDITLQRNSGKPAPNGILSEIHRETGRVVQEVLTVDKQERAAVEADVARVREVGHEVIQHAEIPHSIVVLRHEYVALPAIPPTCPGLVGPAQAEREIWLPVRQHQLEGLFQEPSPAEPVEVVAEAVDAMRARQLRLRLTDLAPSKVVETEIRRYVRYGVARVQRMGSGHVGPVE